MKRSKKQKYKGKTRKQEGGTLIQTQKMPEPAVSECEDIMINGTVLKDSDNICIMDSANMTKKDRKYTEYITERVEKLKAEEGSESACTFIVASLHIAQYESIISGLKSLLRKAGLEDKINSYLSSMTFFILMEDCKTTARKESYKIKEIKHLLFYLCGLFADKVPNSLNCLSMKRDYELMLDARVPCFRIFMLNHCAEFLQRNNVSITIFSPVVDDALLSLFSSALKGSDPKTLTMNDFIAANRDNKQCAVLSGYFDEILDYVVTNDLFNDYTKEH